MMEFNYLASQNAIVRADGRYRVAYGRMPAAIASLAKELLEIEAAGDRPRAESWFQRYDKMPPELASALAGIHDVPVDVEPIYSFAVLPPSGKR